MVKVERRQRFGIGGALKSLVGSASLEIPFRLSLNAAQEARDLESQ
jgi:hypothetical protein